MKRRSFINKCCVSLLGFSAVAPLLTGCPAKAVRHTKVEISPNNELIVRQSVFIKDRYVLLQHPDNKFLICIYKSMRGKYFATLMECTHQSCATDIVAKHIICPCHGSRFVMNGDVIKGPATENLKTFITRAEGDFVYIALG
ncbi:MAG: hypothetical protein COB89_03925 [Piscirickettsiaceae bacterium]|nr:MAG: hypothetical protein COB89_07880 [Piscirickettsiaceae bacterium]PCH84916.1 MAG: hypothetical protein COB89_03925 [Piscirickettsiaceae bacterium]